MTNEEYKKGFQLLKDNLLDNLAIYHERVTLLVRISVFDIQTEGVNFKAQILKPLNKIDAEQNLLYHTMLVKSEISFYASYQFGKDDETPLLVNKKVGRPYCPFTLWLDPELSKFVFENEDDITKQLPNYILWDEDWRVLKQQLQP